MKDHSDSHKALRERISALEAELSRALQRRRREPIRLWPGAEAAGERIAYLEAEVDRMRHGFIGLAHGREFDICDNAARYIRANFLWDDIPADPEVPS